MVGGGSWDALWEWWVLWSHHNEAMAERKESLCDSFV